ncbi:flagellar hook-associated protein FlgK [Cellulomonas fimi]|uniref:Flagellar hook-associated protein 1 n=1 Tax=Cellulomonas fimi TaxID=1708 RepID=A0A7Y0LZF3_CELFI|nr:flagellar hook-associated protein FlgK [Cellulomonas fimi]NMR21026.1 flagellar hook-associated protein FlgK [Cellulomonas fimi]
MSSSFSGLSTALSSLIAQRQALDVAGQNVANANTVGYTRQRADLASVEALSAPSMYSAGRVAGNGTRVTGIERLGDLFLDARLRAETGSASFAATRSETYLRLESTVAEPGDKGVSQALGEFWSAWQELGNTPDSDAARKVVLENASALTQRISSGYAAVVTQWDQARTELDAAVVDVNATAAAVADLNERIRGVLVSGGSANELIDTRSSKVTRLAGLVGASAVEREDGTLDVMVGGNALVRGDKAHAVEVTPGTWTMGSPVALRWAGTGYALGADAGRVAGLVTALAPEADGGILAKAAASYDKLAQALVGQVNGIHTGSYTAGDPQAQGGVFFTEPATGVTAATLAVAITDVKDIAVAADGLGPLDGSRADPMSAIATATGGPDRTWSSFVVDLGVTSRSAAQRASVTEATRTTAERLQLSNASVDIDEESVNMLAYQRAYEGAARVLTAIDEMLDTLINRTGVVGR